MPCLRRLIVSEYIITFLAVFFLDVFYTYFLQAVYNEQVLRASVWSGIVYLVACIAVINYTVNNWLLIPAAIGAFCGTYVGMILRKRKLIK